MNIEKLKYFIDLVECQNFTETAKKNYVSQTTISQQLATLEGEFGNKLIDRKQIPVKPTSAGLIFYKEALAIYKQYQLMHQKMDEYKKNKTELLSIEYAGPTDIKTLTEFMPKFLEENSNIKVETHKETLGEISTALKRGVYDLAITFDSEFIGSPDIETITLFKGEYCVVVSENHPLFNYNEIDLETLYKYPLVMLNPKVIGTSYELMLQHAKEDGFSPEIVRFADDVESEIFYIITEQLIGFFPDHYPMGDYDRSLKKIEIVNSHHSYKIQLAYLKSNKNPALSEFLRYIQNREL